MGYEIHKDNTGITITPSLQQPYLYLDIGAIYNIVEDKTSIRSQFFKAFNSCNATLCLSSHTIGEIWLRDPGAWFNPFLSFLDLIGDRFLFLEFDFFKVIKNEVGKQSYQEASAYDVGFTKEIFKHYFVKKNTKPNLRLLFEGTFKCTRRLEQYRKQHRYSLNNFKRHLVRLRNDNAGKKPPKMQRDAHYTRILMQNILWTIVRDPSWTITDNDVGDLFHTIVPVSWCDFVILDKHWNDVVKRAYNKFAHSTHVYKISQLNNFIEDLNKIGPVINRAFVTRSWMGKLSQQGLGALSCKSS